MEAWQFVRFFFVSTLHPILYRRTRTSLTTKLPFDDDEFDHVHIQSIAAGVPENKVYFSFVLM